MSAFLTILATALLPYGGHIIGSLLAKSMRTPGWVIGAALHAARRTASVVVALP